MSCPHHSPHPRPPLSAGAQARPCPRGWFSFQDDCYGYFPEKLSWERAKARCQSFGSGAHLAAIHSEEEHDAVAGFIARSQRRDDDDVWIGLHIPVQVSGRTCPVGIDSVFTESLPRGSCRVLGVDKSQDSSAFQAGQSLSCESLSRVLMAGSLLGAGPRF
uniref:C-type lectin domain-containing protein n=1 Tax=Terrapene triunguis TaxID=2587831 RepID=A0A674J6D3_9SAUR